MKSQPRSYFIVMLLIFFRRDAHAQVIVHVITPRIGEAKGSSIQVLKKWKCKALMGRNMSMIS
jgi:hypothetical protein